jgi:protein involved in polysaccharide export with SLBB domain
MAELYKRIAVLACFVCILMCAGGCETIAKMLSSDDDLGSAVGPVYFEPRVRPGVALVVVVSSGATQPVSMQVQVDQNGDITLPLLLQEPVACDGLTLEALKQKLVKAYSKYYRQPMITVTFAPYDGKGVSPVGTVTVLGEVGRPGPVNMPPTMDLTVTKVLQEAGGCKQFADKTSIRVTRCDKDGNQTRTYVNLNEIGKDGRVDKDMSLRAGDVVWGPETWY